MCLYSIAAHFSARQIALAGVVFVGCSMGVMGSVGCGQGPGGIGNPDGGLNIDANSPTPEALYVELKAKPGRGPFSGNFEPTLDDIDIELSDFRVIGDSAPGDDRTKVELLSLRFPRDDSRTLAFSDAPIGRYSHIRARINHFKLSGTCVIDGNSLMWIIDIAPPQGIELNIEVPPVELDPGVDAHIKIDVRLDRAFDEADWDTLLINNETIIIDSSYEDFGEIVGKIRNETFAGKS